MSESAVLEVSSPDVGGDDSGWAAAAEGGAGAGEVRDADDAPPLLMETNYDIAVKVDAPMKQLSTLETYVTYRVRCACARWATPPHVRRRYNHFKALRRRLVAAHPLLPVPPLPPLHSARQQLDRYAAGLVAGRTLALHAFLERVAKHPILTHSEELRQFLTETGQEALERALRSEGGGGGAHALWGLGGMLGGLTGDGRATAAVRVKEPELGAAGDYLQSLQHKLAALGALTATLHKHSAALGRHMSDLKPVADAWCSHERGALAVAARAAGAGAHGAGCARVARPTSPAAVLLPQLAAYAGVVRDKILERDALHNSYASAEHPADEAHNRLEQASEALRAELSDWNDKSRAEIRALLLDVADTQLLLQRRALHAWEAALRTCRETPPASTCAGAAVFRTVSAAAARTMSPARAAREHNGVSGEDTPSGDDGSVARESPPAGEREGSEDGGSETRDPLSEMADIDLSRDNS